MSEEQEQVQETEAGQEAPPDAQETPPEGQEKANGKAGEPESDANGKDKSGSEDRKAQLTGEGDQQEQTGDWRAGIEDESLKKHAERFNSPAEAVKGHYDLHRMLSKAIIPPGKDASEEDKAKYLKQLGVPESPDGYEFEVPEGEELSEADKKFQSAMAETFHEALVSADQAKALNKKFNETMAQIRQEKEEADLAADKKYAEETEKALKQEWGPEDFDENRAVSEAAAKHFLGEDFDDVRQLKTRDDRFVLDHPAMLKMLARIGRQMPNDRGEFMTESTRDNLTEQADEARKKRDEAMAKGDNDSARKWDEKERELLGRLHGTAPAA